MTKPTVAARTIDPGPTASLDNPSPQAAVRVLLIGHIERPEMAWAIPPANRGPAGGTWECNTSVGTAGDRVASVCWQRAADFEAAIELIGAGAAIPDVVVLVQPYPGCFAQNSVEDFRRRFPLVRFVCLFGAWCEGESRSGRPLNGVLRLAWHQWPLQQDRQLAALADGQPGPWALPPTATPDEHLLARSARPQRRAGGAVGITSIEQARSVLAHDHCGLAPHIASRAVRWTPTDVPPGPGQAACRLLHDACAARGITGAFLHAELIGTSGAAASRADPRATCAGAAASRASAAMTREDTPASRADGEEVASNRSACFPRPLRAVFAEVTSLDNRARSLVAQLASAVAPAPLAVLANFPRIDQAVAAMAVGAAAVIAKPFDLDDLFDWLERPGSETPHALSDKTLPCSIHRDGV